MSTSSILYLNLFKKCKAIFKQLSSGITYYLYIYLTFQL